MDTAPDFEGRELPFMHPDDMPDLYALRGYGDCMEPLISDGAIIVFDKREVPEAGDIVSIIFTREAAERWKLPGLVKRLAMALPPIEMDENAAGNLIALVVVDQLNPPRRYCIRTTDVLAVHKFVGLAESNGVETAIYRPRTSEAA